MCGVDSSPAAMPATSPGRTLHTVDEQLFTAKARMGKGEVCGHEAGGAIRGKRNKPHHRQFFRNASQEPAEEEQEPGASRELLLKLF